MPLLHEEQHIGQTYIVERYLGEGAFAEVYRVQHRFLGRQALKILKTRGMSLKEIEAMLDEAILLSRIGHPNIVRVFDANTLETGNFTYSFFTMEYVPGGTLDRYWQSYKNRLMPVDEAVAIVKQICSGISVAHAESPAIVHRDIKPQNILVGYDRNGMLIRVSDFGLAKRVNPMTLMVSAKGTLSFKPPESLKNHDSCSADIWAIGTTFYLLLTDTLPYPGLDKRGIDNADRFLTELKPPSFYNIRVDADLDDIVLRCLSKDQTKRYSNAAYLLEALNQWSPIENNDRKVVAPSKNEKSSKTIFMNHSPTDHKQQMDRLAEAVRLSQLPGKLPVAADILEELINKDYSFRAKYASQLQLWRKGIIM